MSTNVMDDFFNEKEMLGAISDVETKKFWRPTKNKTIIRILPPLKPNGEKLFYFTHRVHWVNKIPYECINQTQVDKDGQEHVAENCPICNLAKKLYKLGEGGDSESDALARRISGKTRHVVRIIVRGEEESEGKIFFYELPQKIHKMLMDNISSGEWGSVVHPTKGRDLIIIKNGTGVQTDYSSSQLSPKETPIYPETEKVVAILQEAVKKPYHSLIAFKSSEEFDNVVREIARGSVEDDGFYSSAPTPKAPVEKTHTKKFDESYDVPVADLDDVDVSSDDDSGSDDLEDLLAELSAE